MKVRGMKMNCGCESLLLGQAYLLYQLCEAEVGKHGFVEVSPQAEHSSVALLIGYVEPLEGLVFVSQASIEGRNKVSG